MTDYEIFRSCFPQLSTDEKSFLQLAFPENAKVFRREGGFACVNGNRITALCVAPELQRKGIGTALLQECENYIKQNGGKTAIVSGLLAGVPDSGAYFFKANGYTLSGDFTEMQLPLAELSMPEASLPDNVEFRFFDGALSEMRAAVAEVDEEWVQYFDEDGVFFCGYQNGELASFCIVGEHETCLLSGGESDIGSIGCVGTVPKFRKQGIGLNMVALGAKWLKERGCDNVFIHYTHLYKWYAKLGASVLLRFSAAEKEL